jgi:hypothetical protein
VGLVDDEIKRTIRPSFVLVFEPAGQLGVGRGGSMTVQVCINPHAHAHKHETHNPFSLF